MTTLTAHPEEVMSPIRDAPDTLWQRVRKSGRVLIGSCVVLAGLLASIVTLPLTTNSRSDWYFDAQKQDMSRHPPTFHRAAFIWGADGLGRSVLARCLLGGAVSLAIGICAAVISVTVGVSVGLVSGYRGGWVDSLLMRLVDILYGLPYILLVILLKIAVERPISNLIWRVTGWPGSGQVANFIVMFFSLGAVSWLTMARVVRGQVLSLRSQPFIEACKAAGLTERRIFTHHLLPNLIGPITVYTTLIIPGAILGESFLSFLGIGIQPPVPTWGSLASDALLPALNPINSRWWMLLFPCVLLAITLLCLNFCGDGLRDVFDPHRGDAKI